jgi:hypothetical protein
MRTGSVSKYIQDLLWEETCWSGPSTEETVALTVPIRAAYTPPFG